MIIETLSTFPHMFDSVMGASMMRIAQEKGILDFAAWDLRDWTHDRHRTTDDEPYGGGQGLVMKCEPIFEAYDDIVMGRVPGPACQQAEAGAGAGHPAAPGPFAQVVEAAESGQPMKPCTVFLSPCGTPFDEALATQLAGAPRLLFVCGHYEGIDERAYSLADEVVSIGDYVLTSGELAAMVVIDAVVRKLPGVLGDEGSSIDESFYDGLLEYPQYTRPASYRGMDVPDVLLSGDHGAVEAWRRQQRLVRTAALRPDLLELANLTPDDRSFLESSLQGHAAKQ